MKDYLRELPRVLGVGRFGVGRHNSNIEGTAKPTRAYAMWYNILHRCYSWKDESKKVYRAGDGGGHHLLAYENTTVCDDWLCFQNFADWFELQNPKPGWHLDKDVLSEDGLSKYGPDTCVFIPQELNVMLTTKSLGEKGYREVNESFRVTIREGGEQRYIGSFKTECEARQVYVTLKYQRVCDVLKKYETELSEDLINKIKKRFLKG